jgi:hypothetical protein
MRFQRGFVKKLNIFALCTEEKETKGRAVMATLDLKPLTDETIQQMGFNNHDLWLVKIHEEVFGPFETESLKHYASENEEQFDEALATSLENNNYQSFWSHPLFQRRKIQAAETENHEGPFWLMEFGLKIGPISFREVDKKIEMGLLGMTDHISVDDGETWHKIYKFHGFDRRSHEPDELPIAPMEASFQKAKLVLIEKLETPSTHASDEIATMVHLAQKDAKVITFKLDELTLSKANDVSVSRSIKWVLPTAMALGLTIVTSGYFMLTGETEEAHMAQTSEIQATRVRKITPPPRGQIPSVSNRAPASTGYQYPSQPRAIHNQESRYPTTVETHQAPDQMDDYNYDQHLERDPLDGPVMEANNMAEEHSLVGNREPQSDASVDDVMNGGANHEPVVEEVSDF